MFNHFNESVLLPSFCYWNQEQFITREQIPVTSETVAKREIIVFKLYGIYISKQPYMTKHGKWNGTIHMRIWHNPLNVLQYIIIGYERTFEVSVF